MINLEMVYPPSTEEYVLLEMQGTIENSGGGESLNAMPLGDLVPLEGKKYKFMIGMHDLIGIKVELNF
jgi:hypothetical protein